MPLESGYSYISLHTWTATINPVVYRGFRAEKPIIRTTTITGTITQHWQIKPTDKIAYMEWRGNLPKDDVDDLIALFEADYEYYVFTDIYGSTHNVVISKLDYDRRTTLDSDGFSLTMELVKV